MALLDDLIGWLDSRPLWQRDAARRVGATAALSEGDVRDLADIAIAEAQGHPVEERVEPVRSSHLVAAPAAGPTVKLIEIEATSNLNAISPGSVLRFADSGLTVIFGGNGSGKSGYVRLLKKACRARASEEAILPNVFVDVAPPAQATVRYRTGDTDAESDWSADGADTFHADLRRVAVYDRACASVYVDDENQVAYRPFGLDLLDNLAGAVQLVRSQLISRRSGLVSAIEVPPPDLLDVEPLASVWPIRVDTEVGRIEELDVDLEAQAVEIRETEAALSAEDPEGDAAALRALIGILNGVLRDIRNGADVVSDERIAIALGVAQADSDASLALRTLQAEVLSNDPVPGVGSETWRRLWQAAEAFTVAEAYPGHEHPYVAPEARCVLCGQEIDEHSADRLTRLHRYAEGELASAASVAQRALEEVVAELESCRSLGDNVRGLEELREARPDLVPAADAAIRAIVSRASATLRVLMDPATDPLDALAGEAFDGISDLGDLAAAAEALASGLELARRAADPTEALELSKHLKELRAMDWAVRNKSALLSEHERLQQLSALERAIDGCDTQPITLESNQLTQRYVTSALEARVDSELDALGAGRIRVKLAWRGARAVPYHRFELRNVRYGDARVGEVVSEGEFGAVALAAFFAELSQGGGESTIVLDDPVSSLDHIFRRRVAGRIADEALRRPVIVFTHDLVFMHELEAAAASRGASVHATYLRADAAGVGVPGEQAPWRGMTVGQRVDSLRSRLVQLRLEYESGEESTYETSARDWFGLLRETWELTVEEVLFGKAVVRFRDAVVTRHLVDKGVWAIERGDVLAVIRGMEESSKWIRGHDQPATVDQPMPTPNELEAHLSELDQWHQDLRTRQRAAAG